MVGRTGVFFLVLYGVLDLIIRIRFASRDALGKIRPLRQALPIGPPRVLQILHCHCSISARCVQLRLDRLAFLSRGGIAYDVSLVESFAHTLPERSFFRLCGSFVLRLDRRLRLLIPILRAQTRVLRPFSGVPFVLLLFCDSRVLEIPLRIVRVHSKLAAAPTETVPAMPLTPCFSGCCNISLCFLKPLVDALSAVQGALELLLIDLAVKITAHLINQAIERPFHFITHI